MFLLLAGGCSKFLDVNPKGEVFDNDMFTTAAGYEDALYGIYAELGTVSGLYSDYLWWIPEALCVNETISDNGLQYMAMGQWSAYNAATIRTTVWKAAYAMECQMIGEPNRDFEAVDFGFGNNDWLIALGGGGILDVTGFCAGIYEGGINFLAVPTTPDSMYEGAVAKKAFLNSKKLKNAISVPFSPAAVIIDPSYLKTVPDNIKHNGYADIIRLGILGNLNIIIELVKEGNVREFLNHTYALRHKVNEASPKLLTLGNELSAAIEGYFRFMNYSEGEALALSLISCVEERSRVPLSKIYNVLGLPTRLEGVSVKSIMKILNDNIARSGNKNLEVVDMSDDEPRKWVIKSLTPDEAREVFAKRLELIKSLTEGSAE